MDGILAQTYSILRVHYFALENKALYAFMYINTSIEYMNT